jgi:peptidoglycan/xylan/chitin deacetylase (PgdA/CDA1 family)
MRRAPTLRPYTSPSVVEEIFVRELDGAWEEQGLFVLTMHPHHIGHRSRVWIIERVIEHAKAKGGCWFSTHEQAARWCKQQAGL